MRGFPLESPAPANFSADFNVNRKSDPLARLMICALLACAAPAARAADALSSAAAAQIDAIAKAWVQAGNAAGVAVGAARDGEIIFARGYGYSNLDDRASGTEVRTNVAYTGVVGVAG